ncbi:MAG: phage tail protein [Myxococcota bacterium]
MALSREEIKNSYPLPVYNYRVEIDGTAVSFAKVSGLSMSYETTTYKQSQTEGGKVGPVVMHMPSQPSNATVTLEKGLVTADSMTNLYEWIQSVQLNQVDKKDIYVRLLDEAGSAIISWKVSNAFPTKLDAPSFDANGNDVAVETMELMADAVMVEVL